MFDVGFFELLLVAVVALLVFGPERLPHVIKSVASWVAKAKFFTNNLKEEFEREANLSEMRAELEAQRLQFRKELERVENQLKESSRHEKVSKDNALDESGT